MAIGFDKTSVNKQTESKASKKVDTEDVDSYDNYDAALENDVVATKKRNIIIGAAIGLVALGVLGAFLGSSKSDDNQSDTNIDSAVSTTTDDGDNQSQQTNESQSNGAQQNDSNAIYDTDGNTIDPNGINPGITDYKHSINNQTSPYVYDASDYIKDLNGLDVSAVYNVESTNYIVDYVSYETRRAEIDDGMELYWLEAKYSGKTYRIQVPFYYFKDLGTEGICKVEMEVLSLVGGGKIISYMEVVDDSYTGRK